MRRLGVLAVLLGFLVLFAAVAAPAARDQTVIINNYGAVPFVYGGYSYIPLKSATDFLGAALLWDRVKNQALITYNGKDLALTIGSPVAYYGGAPVYLPAAPVMIDNRVFIPTMVVKEHFGVPVVWDARGYEVRIFGRHGWGTLVVARETPVHVVRIMRRVGPPPWAGGPGRRLAPPPGLAKKPGGLPPGQAKKQKVVIIEERGGRGQGHGRGHGRGAGQDD